MQLEELMAPSDLTHAAAHSAVLLIYYIFGLRDFRLIFF